LFKIEFSAPLKSVRLTSMSSKKTSHPLNFQRKEACTHSNLQKETKKNLYLQNLSERRRAEEEKELKAATEMLKRAVEQIELERQKMVMENEKEVLKMVMTIARKVIKKETEIDPEIIIRVARDALKQIADARKIVIKVNPLDWKKVKEKRQEILPPEISQDSIQIEEDKSIQRGGCIVKTEKEIIDARIDQQISEIEKVLMEIEGE